MDDLLNKRKNRSNFTKEEIDFIVQHAETKSTRWIADSLNREVGSVGNKKKLLVRDGKIGFNRVEKQPLKKEEEEFIRANFYQLGITGCAKALGRSPMMVFQRAKKWGLKVREDILFDRFDISHFENLQDPFVIYFLGYFWADGSITGEKKHRIKFKINNLDFYEAISPNQNKLGDFWNYGEYDPPKNKPHWKKSSVLEVTNLYLWRFFYNFDYRSKTGASADKILNAIPEELRHYWWRGYFDGDGSIPKDKGIISFNACYDQDWTFMKILENKLDINFMIERKDRGDRKGSKAIASAYAQTKRFYEYIYSGEEFGLKRKRDRFEYYLTNIRQKKPGATSKYWGVSWNENCKKWTMQISANNLKVHERYADEVEAAKRYDFLALQAYGNKAVLNFPNE